MPHVDDVNILKMDGCLDISEKVLNEGEDILVHILLCYLFRYLISKRYFFQNGTKYVKKKYSRRKLRKTKKHPRLTKSPV